MHPVNSNDFGLTGMKIIYNDGTTANVSGHIVKQLGTTKYVVAPGGIDAANVSTYVTVSLATLSAHVANIAGGSLPTNVGTIQVVVPANSNAVEHAMKITTRKLTTIEGHTFNWRRTTASATNECNVVGDWNLSADADGFVNQVNV